MNKAGWKKRAVQAAVISGGLWGFMGRAAYAVEADYGRGGPGGPGDGHAPHAVLGLFGNPWITDILVCVLFALVIFLFLLCASLSARKNRSVMILRKKIEELERKLTKKQKELRASQQTIEEKVAALSAAHPEHQDTGDDMPQTVIMDGFLNEYNKLSQLNGCEGRTAQDAFVHKHNIRFFTCANRDLRVAQDSLPPVFQTTDSSSGTYWALQIDRKGGCIVVPNPSLKYENQIHSVGGMKEAFQSNYDSGSYGHIEVLRPAIFQCVNEDWNLQKAGHLRLS